MIDWWFIFYFVNSLTCVLFSDVILQKGITVIVDAQKTTARITRQHARYIYNLFEGLKVSLYLVKSEGFWEKHVETCTKGQGKGEVRIKRFVKILCKFKFKIFEFCLIMAMIMCLNIYFYCFFLYTQPIVLSKARLTKFFDLSSLPEELGGTLQFNYDVWLQQRKVSHPMDFCMFVMMIMTYIHTCVCSSMCHNLRCVINIFLFFK